MGQDFLDIQLMINPVAIQIDPNFIKLRNLILT